MDFISRNDLSFLLHDWLKVGSLTNHAVFADHNRDTFDQILDLSADLARDYFAPHFKTADQHEPRLVDGKVEIADAIGPALHAFAQAGFFASAFSEELGGTHLPMVVAAASFAHFCAANLSTAGYAMLTTANARLLAEYGTDTQVKTWAMPEIEGRYFGTMCLSEPQAGSSLADIRTHALPEAEDAFGVRHRIRGNKMWISGGDQEISENIVHLVLAKSPDEDGHMRRGTKAISLFIVPKFLPDGTRNDISVAGLNHKMGYRGTVNCLLNFGENNGATGWRVGKAGEGLPIMFHMMNEARIMVGLGAAALAYRGYTHSLAYAKERPQGRKAGSGSDPSDKPVPIIGHADVKRMVMSQKAIAEGAMALVLYASFLTDRLKVAETDDERREMKALLELLTPIVKSWPSEFGLMANDQAIQVHGGYGYTREYDVEQIYRDNRLNPIHEGTHGIQALDFLGRKVLGDDGRAFRLLRREVETTLVQARQHAQLVPFADALAKYFKQGQETIDAVIARKQHPNVLDNASHALSAFGHLIVAWLWLDKTVAAMQPGEGRAPVRDSKLSTCRYFFECELPKITHQLSLIRTMNTAADVPLSVFE